MGVGKGWKLERRLGGVLGIYLFIYFFAHFYFPAPGQAVVTGLVPSPPRFLPSIFIAHRVQQSHCSSIFHRVLLTHALALTASQFVHKKKSGGRGRIFWNVGVAGRLLSRDIQKSGTNYQRGRKRRGAGSHGRAVKLRASQVA